MAISTMTGGIDQRLRAGLKQITDFNERYDVGALVRYFPGPLQRDYVYTTIRSRAWCLPTGEPLVHVDATANPVPLMRVAPIETEERDEC